MTYYLVHTIGINVCPITYFPGSALTSAPTYYLIHTIGYSLRCMRHPVELFYITAYYLLLTAYCLLLTAYYLLLTAYHLRLLLSGGAHSVLQARRQFTLFGLQPAPVTL